MRLSWLDLLLLAATVLLLGPFLLRVAVGAGRALGALP